MQNFDHIPDRTLIYGLFDAITKLSARLFPEEQLRLVKIEDAPSGDAELPVGMFDVYWTQERASA